MNSRNLGDRVGERFEEIKLEGSQLVDKVKELAKESKTKRITIIKDGKTLADFPLYLGLGGSVAAVMLQPHLAAIGAIAALATDVTVRIERDPTEGIERRPSENEDDLP